MPEIASSHTALSPFIGKVVANIIQPIVGFLFALALVLFLWGAAKYLMNADDANERKQGQQNMIWGIVGLFIMVSVLGIISVIKGTFGL